MAVKNILRGLYDKIETFITWNLDVSSKNVTSVCNNSVSYQSHRGETREITMTLFCSGEIHNEFVKNTQTH